MRQWSSRCTPGTTLSIPPYTRFSSARWSRRPKMGVEMIQDASFLGDLAHGKGHPSCGFGAAFKNLALGCVVGETRSAMHDTMQYDPYWFPEKCPDENVRKQIIRACPYEALVE